METTSQPLAEPVPDESRPALSLWSRTIAVFARPADAWGGLERRGQWWFPLLVSVVIAVAGTAITYQRALVPTMMAGIERKVESEEIPAASAERIEEQMAGPVAMAANLGAILVMVPVMTLVMALIPWIAVGFMLGRRLTFRDAFVVTAWAGLVQVPAQVLTSVLAWINQTMEHLHTGFGVLLPVVDPPSKLMTGLGIFLDLGIGPLYLWYVAVLALGAAALSGAPRRRVLLTLGGVWLAVVVVFAVLAAMFAPGA
jgi:hypothetical protein